jgi:hypothetical protein
MSEATGYGGFAHRSGREWGTEGGRIARIAGRVVVLFGA